MTIFKPTLASVHYVAANMRAADREEIDPLRFDPSPESLAATVMSDPTYVWLAAAPDPIAVFGMFEVRPRAWTAFAFATDDFPKVAASVTKFLIRHVAPHLFNTLGAVRIEAHSHVNHAGAHRWLERLGAKGTLDPEYGPNGESYVHFVCRRSDYLGVTEEKIPPTIGALGGKPCFASSAQKTARAHVHPLHSDR